MGVHRHRGHGQHINLHFRACHGPCNRRQRRVSGILLGRSRHTSHGHIVVCAQIDQQAIGRAAGYARRACGCSIYQLYLLIFDARNILCGDRVAARAG
jgi:hypothetical protein